MQAVLGMDILCQAKSGMGKTAVFVLATLQQIEPVDGQVCFKFTYVCDVQEKYSVSTNILDRLLGVRPLKVLV